MNWKSIIPYILTSYSLFWKFSKEMGAPEAIKNHEFKYILVNEYQIKGNKIEKHTWKRTIPEMEASISKT